MRAGITYARAHLIFSEKDLPGALLAVNKSIYMFTNVNDLYGVDMALVLKTDLQVSMNLVEEAKDTYRIVMHSSKLNREGVHYSRALLGLIEIYISESNFMGARRLMTLLELEDTPDRPVFCT